MVESNLREKMSEKMYADHKVELAMVEANHRKVLEDHLEEQKKVEANHLEEEKLLRKAMEPLRHELNFSKE